MIENPLIGQLVWTTCVKHWVFGYAITSGRVVGLEGDWVLLDEIENAHKLPWRKHVSDLFETEEEGLAFAKFHADEAYRLFHEGLDAMTKTIQDELQDA